MTLSANAAPHTHLQEISVPAEVVFDAAANSTQFLVRRFHQAPEHIACERRVQRTNGETMWQQISTAQLFRDVSQLAKGMMARGVQPGDTVMILAQTQYLWAVADQAALFAGAIVVPVYDSAPHAFLRAVIADTGTTFFIVDTVAVAEELEEAMRSGTGIGVNTADIWVMNDGGARDLSVLSVQGSHITDQDLEARRSLAVLDDVATIVFTSGTTAEPKGAVITHRNLVAQVEHTAKTYAEVVTETGNTVLFLPLTHVLGRALQLICIANGMRIAYLAQPKEVIDALRELRPTFLVVVPRVLEKIREAAAQAAAAKHISWLWQDAERKAELWGEFLERADEHAEVVAPRLLRVKRALYDRVFFSRLRDRLGGKMTYLLSGAATLEPRTARFFRGIGVPVIQGYGLTETTAPLTASRVGALRAGSVGLPIPGNTVRIAENGEVLARGLGVCSGYRNPADTAAAFVDGFFRTGDLGWLAADGTLTLTGRLKHTIITSTGRTLQPEPWEQLVESHPLIAYAMLLGTDRPYVTAVLILDAEATRTWCAARGEAFVAEPESQPFVQQQHPALLAELDVAVQQANATVIAAARAQRWSAVVLSDARLDACVTPTMKLKRDHAVAELSAVIHELYDPKH